MNVHSCTVLPESTEEKKYSVTCMLVFVLSAAKQQQSAIHMIILVDLELIGDNGGDVGAGVSASSSSSSPHSSSLSGVMLLPSHTEWIDT